MNRKEYPELLERRLASYNIAIIVLIGMGIAEWVLMDIVYGLFLGPILAIAIAIIKNRFRKKVCRVGFVWMRFRVIDHTYLSHYHRKPTGFIALSVSEEDILCRYHFALSDRMETPRIGDTLDICVPRDAEVSEIGRTLYVSKYYGIRKRDSR